MAHYAKVVEQYSVIAELLKASHVENPKGKESVVLAGARCAGYWRDARNGLHTAAEGLLKSSLPLDGWGIRRLWEADHTFPGSHLIITMKMHIFSMVRRPDRRISMVMVPPCSIFKCASHGTLG